ncbi:MAG: cellulose biosynthesis protein BcsN [Bauldia sp.]|nr:cellulose biosynthesis protein BcsN [Bauldia sp.]
MTEGRGLGASRPLRRVSDAGRKPAAGRIAVWAAPLVLALAGCTTVPEPATLQQATEAIMVPSEQAFAVPAPAGPAVISVVQRRHYNAVEQEIVLGQSSNREGQNFIRIQLFGPAPFRMATHATIDNNLLDMGDIWEEMDEAVPNVGMTVSPFFVQNKYGAFGYAVGYYSNDLCLYAWQRVGAASTTLEDESRDAAIGLRLRICRTGATEAQLIEVMYGLTITTYYTDAAWAPHGTGVLDIVPLQEIRPPRDVLERPRATAPRAATTATAAAPVIVPTGPAVPLPPGATPTGGTGTPTGPTVPLPP